MIAYILKGLRAFLATITGILSIGISLFSGAMFIIIAIGNSHHPSGMGPEIGFMERAVIFLPLCGGGSLTLFLGVITYFLWPWKDPAQEEIPTT